VEPIVGGFAATLYRVRAWDEQGKAVDAVYKRFVEGRDAELSLYEKIASELPYGLPALYGIVEEEFEKGILVADSGLVLKPEFRRQGRAEQEGILADLVGMLAELHVTFAGKGAEWAEDGVISSYPYESSLEWARAALERLGELVDAEGGVVTRETVQDVTAMVDAFYPRYQEWTAGRQTFTHGDPHMENILIDGGRLRLIDWEYASLALPQRDLSILLQDVLDEGLHEYALSRFRGELVERGWEVGEDSFLRGFHACLFDNTLMMMGWEIYKFQMGNLEIGELEEIMTAKVGWMRRCFAELMGS
jgi:hypothetical protein